MIDIEHIEPEVKVTYFDGDFYLAFKFIDIPGTVRKANISAYALKSLYDAFQEAQFAMIEQMAPDGQEIGLKLTVGPTRGEVYGVEASP